MSEFSITGFQVRNLKIYIACAGRTALEACKAKQIPVSEYFI
jgi:hypothetical protein